MSYVMPFDVIMIMTAWQTGSGSDLVIEIVGLLIPIVLFVLLWRFLTGYQASVDQRFERLDRRMGELAEKADRLNHTLAGLGQQASDNTHALVNAMENLSIAASAPVAAVSGRKPDQSSTVESATQATTQSAQAADSSSPESLQNALMLLGKPDENYPDNLLQARDLLLPLVDGPHQTGVTVALAETLFWLGDISDNKAEQERYHGEGVAHGKKAVALAPDDVAANLWYAANMGSHGVARGIMSSLFYLGDIEKHGKKAMDLDKYYFHAAPLRLMGRFYHQCPGWPIGSGDKNKAIKTLQEAVSLGPDFLLNHLYLAEVLIDKRKKREARQHLDQIIESREFKLMPVYHERIRNEARKLISKT